MRVMYHTTAGAAQRVQVWVLPAVSGHSWGNSQWADKGGALGI